MKPNNICYCGAYGGGVHTYSARCRENDAAEALRQQRITTDMPTGSLPASSVSLQELVNNATLTLPPRYEIGEDWNDD